MQCSSLAHPLTAVAVAAAAAAAAAAAKLSLGLEFLVSVNHGAGSAASLFHLIFSPSLAEANKRLKFLLESSSEGCDAAWDVEGKNGRQIRSPYLTVSRHTTPATTAGCLSLSRSSRLREIPFSSSSPPHASSSFSSFLSDALFHPLATVCSFFQVTVFLSFFLSFFSQSLSRRQQQLTFPVPFQMIE